MNLRRALLALALVSVSSSAFAASADDSFEVRIQINNRCTITASDIDFGAIDDLSAALVSTGSVNVKCNQKGGAYSVAFDIGSGAGATFATRKLEEVNGDTINYSLYRDGALSEILGDGSAGTARLTGDSSAVNGRNVDYTIHAQVFANQNGKAVGSYSDTVTATVVY